MKAQPTIAGPALLLRMRGLGLSELFQRLAGRQRDVAEVAAVCPLDSPAAPSAVIDNWALAAALQATHAALDGPQVRPARRPG